MRAQEGSLLTRKIDHNPVNPELGHPAIQLERLRPERAVLVVVRDQQAHVGRARAGPREIEQPVEIDQHET